MPIRLDRILALEFATKEYMAAERTRIENEVKVLEAILKGRTGGKGLQKKSKEVLFVIAKDDLAAYLRGKD